jgi:membrane-associated phospholipid phosphatase
VEQLDHNILYFFNYTIANTSLDALMSFLTNARNWIPVYALASSYLIWRHKWYGVRIVVAVALLAGFTDAFTNLYIKEFVERPRPCAIDAAGLPTISWLRLPDGGRGGFSMPSSHAVNNFAAVAFFLLLFPSRRTGMILFFIALLVAITRLYLGLHYPSDVAAGALFGLIIGYLFGKSFLWIEEKYFSKPNSIA